MSDPTILYPVSNTSREEFLAERKKQKYFITGMRFFILIFILAGWEIAARYHLIDAFIFSSPTRIFKVMLQMAADKSLFYHIGITIGETLVSFVLVLIIGTLIAMLLWWCRSAADILEPYFVVLNSLPKTALAPILIVWLGNNMKTIIVCGVTMAVFSTSSTFTPPLFILTVINYCSSGPLVAHAEIFFAILFFRPASRPSSVT